MTSFTTQTRSGEAASIVWSISFGDLLTLLVCFFLVLTPWDKLKIPPKPQKTQDVGALPMSMDLVGINLAPLPVDDESIEKAVASESHGTLITRDEFSPRDRKVALAAEIPLFEKDVKLLSISGIENLRASIGRELSSDAAKSTSVLIRVCDMEVDFDRVVPMVGRILLENGVKEEKIVVSLPMTTCDRDVTLRPVSDTVVGSITFLKDQREVKGRV